MRSRPHPFPFHLIFGEIGGSSTNISADTSLCVSQITASTNGSLQRLSFQHLSTFKIHLLPSDVLWDLLYTNMSITDVRKNNLFSRVCKWLNSFYPGKHSVRFRQRLFRSICAFQLRIRCASMHKHEFGIGLRLIRMHFPPVLQRAKYFVVITFLSVSDNVL